ncbi:MAG: hypothetical protein ACNS60_08965 [Candidatus Cyclobacteriaceae bacterium M2_1C_046]
MKIQIGKGFDDFILGSKQDEVITAKGDPDKLNDINEESDQYIIYYYYNEQVKLYFDKSRNYKLISIEVYNKEAFFLDTKIIDTPEKELRSLLFKNKIKYDVEEYPSFHVLYIPTMQIYINIEMDRVRSVEIQPLLKDEKLVWPKK